MDGSCRSHKNSWRYYCEIKTFVNERKFIDLKQERPGLKYELFKKLNCRL